MEFKPVSKKSLRNGDFDLDNVIIPPSPNVQIPIIKKKEIFTPTWRIVDTEIHTELMACIKMDDQAQSSGEDTSDEYYIRQHAIKEVEEQRRYTEPLKNHGFKKKTQGINSKDLSKIPKTSIITEFFVMADDLEFSPAPVSPIFGSPNFQTHRAHHAKNKRALNNIKNSAQKQQLAIQSELQLETQQEIQNRLKREASNNNKKEKEKEHEQQQQEENNDDEDNESSADDMEVDDANLGGHMNVNINCNPETKKISISIPHTVLAAAQTSKQYRQHKHKHHKHKKKHLKKNGANYEVVSKEPPVNNETNQPRNVIYLRKLNFSRLEISNTTTTITTTTTTSIEPKT